ncbi:GTPase-activating protein [Botryosphaeria dothidea]
MPRISSLSSSSRPRSPPAKNPYGHESPPASRAGTVTSPGRKPYSYSSNDPDDDEDDDDEEPDITFDDDEDEFGLPSIASMRRKGKRKPLNKGKDPGGTGSALTSPLGSDFGSAHWRMNSGDIAEERNGGTIPLYPTAKPTVGKILRPQYKDILRDPANALHLIAHPALPPGAPQKEVEEHSARIGRINKFKRILQSSNISLQELRSTAWSGIPVEVRAMTWQLLLGYLPSSSERRIATLERKRREYLEAVRQAFEKSSAGSDMGITPALATSKGRGRGLDEAIWHQISIDVPRTNPHLELYSYEATQRSLERILYVWAIRHPASGYVQGINDLVTPFWQVFLGAYITDPDIESGMDPGQLPKPVLDAVEADSFWCLTKLLDGIQDNYIFAQPGIQRQVASLRDLTTRIDKTLATHLEREGVEFIQFSFRWMNCLLMREISVKNTIRMWDTYLETLQAEERGFSDFHLYVCAAFLVKWSDQLVKMDFQEIMMFLQSLPTRNWTEKDIELLLSEAFIWQSLFRGSSAHLKGQGTKVGNGTVGMGPG